jgi:hypothetical protein
MGARTRPPAVRWAGAVGRADGRGTQHIEAGLGARSGKQRPEHLHGVVVTVEEQLAKAFHGAISYRLGRVSRQRQKIGLGRHNVLELEPHGEMDIRLGRVDNFFMIGTEHCERPACVAQVREQWYEELRKDTGLVGSLHGAPL